MRLLRWLPLAALLLAAPVVRAAEPEPDAPIKVRALAVKGMLPLGLGGGKVAKAFTNEADLARATNKALAAELSKSVKWDRESVVMVSYGVSGPPFPALEHEVKKKERLVEFYYKEPKGPRNLALKLGLEFFAVTKGASVKYVGAR